MIRLINHKLLIVIRRLNSNLPKVVIMHRHGHRAAAKSIDNSSSERIMWAKLQPNQEKIDSLMVNFPVVNQNIHIPTDLASHPFGCLTSKGLEHMEYVGKQYSDILCRYQNRMKVKVFSTNFQRTQMSAQAFLLGCLGLNSKVEIVVQDRNICPMSFYEGKPQIARKAIQKVQSSPLFKELEHQSADIERLVSSIFPLTIGSRGKFDWFMAFDYFACRAMHSIPIDEKLTGVEERILDHVSHRYRLYLSDPTHLAHFAYPMLLSIRTHLASSDATLFSGHDVNILGMLYAVGAEVTEPSLQLWPDVGSVLMLQLNNNSIEIFFNHSKIRVNIARVFKIFDYKGFESSYKYSISLEELDLLLDVMDKEMKKTF